METVADDVQTLERESESLSAHDRCDSCGSQAYVRAVMDHGELLFCAHHAKKHQEKLSPMVKQWHDETHRLDVAP